MDKQILTALTNAGLITFVGLDADKFTDAYDLVRKGIITCPGAEKRIDEILKSFSKENTEIITDTPKDDETPLVDTPTDVEPLVDTPIDETPLVDIPIDEVPTVVEDETVEVKKTSKRNTKKTE